VLVWRPALISGLRSACNALGLASPLREASGQHATYTNRQQLSSPCRASARAFAKFGALPAGRYTAPAFAFPLAPFWGWPTRWGFLAGQTADDWCDWFKTHCYSRPGRCPMSSVGLARSPFIMRLPPHVSAGRTEPSNGFRHPQQVPRQFRFCARPHNSGT